MHGCLTANTGEIPVSSIAEISRLPSKVFGCNVYDRQSEVHKNARRSVGNAPVIRDRCNASKRRTIISELCPAFMNAGLTEDVINHVSRGKD